MRVLSERLAIRVTQPSHVWRARFFVIDKNPPPYEAALQLPRTFFESSTPSLHFKRLYENAQFIVYER